MHLVKILILQSKIFHILSNIFPLIVKKRRDTNEDRNDINR